MYIIDQPAQQELNLEEKQWYSMALGDLTLFLQQNGNELLTAVNYQSRDKPALREALRKIDDLPQEVKVGERLYSGPEEESVYIELQLADKPYQVNADTPIKLGPKGRVVLYVSTSLWVQLKTIDTQKVMTEYPAVIPRMSWVGSSSIEGALCYSTKTAAPSELSQVSRKEHRAITALEIVNDSSHSPLTIQRLSLPLNMLSLFYSESAGFWTESIRFRMDAETGETVIVTSQKPPDELGGCEKISTARDSKQSSRLRTAMKLIMG
ncbi:hypothetical protein [Neptuniibacter sp. 1_MG-2023]|uniref:hypothetical protein n=1 Tax=Neptuniibacter sp. 1_MG-2023 TaxID=3062662 RepID=UPI0026E4908D|nr:hypothetical protein [Neptuniibacter sp. 1_MG-2023]MDO6592501.1 hypothetical protein [Neptuniibacter sp. 1_MG-2023]